MRIGIDFDNTIICYDQVFSTVAKQKDLVSNSFEGGKRELRDTIRTLPDGETSWMRLQGKVYGEFIGQAQMFAGFKTFIAACNANPDVEVFIVSHKTEFGHFDEKKINLRDAARGWLRQQGFFDGEAPFIRDENCFFETTREEKIARIESLGCTHFIDDLTEVLFAPIFPESIHKYLFNPAGAVDKQYQATAFTNWNDINHAIFSH